MRAQAIELWALSVLERVAAGQTFEDARVEMKRSWPDPQKAARRIAAHANTARGEPILWLIGVDQQAATISNAPPVEMSEWWNSVTSYFNEIAPALVDVAVPFRDVVVMALMFESDRAPFLVKNPDERIVQFEIPWRDGTRTRTARRNEVLRILAPLHLAPTVDLVDATLTAYWDETAGVKPARCEWYLEGHLYVTISTARLVIPFHTCKAEITFRAARKRLSFSRIALGPNRYGIGTEDKPSLVVSTGAEAVFDGHSMAAFLTSNRFEPDPPDEDAHVEIVISAAGIDRPVVLSFTLARDAEKPHAQQGTHGTTAPSASSAKAPRRIIVKWVHAPDAAAKQAQLDP